MSSSAGTRPGFAFRTLIPERSDLFEWGPAHQSYTDSMTLTLNVNVSETVNKMYDENERKLIINSGNYSD